MKKIICAVFVAAMLVSLLAAFVIAADEPEAIPYATGTPEISLSVLGGKATVGETVKIAVGLKAPATSVIGVFLSDYDTDLLTWTGGEWEAIEGIKLPNVQLADKTASCAIAPAVDIDGSVLALSFDVKDGIEPCETSIDLVVIVKSDGVQTSTNVSIDVEIAEGYMLGDVNGDSDVTNADALVIFKYIFNPALYPIENFEAADVNRDGDISNADVLAIFKYIFDPKLYPLTGR